MHVISRVRRFIRQHDLMRPESRVALAVSGGSDSMALLHIVRELAAEGALSAVGVVHFNHQLRPTALTHERFVALAAASCGLPFVCGREDVAARRAREGGSIEHAARRARYEFFERARLDLGADLVALGHTRDDQAETVLLRLLRGAGPRGLAGMHPRSGTIVRPILDCGRAELRAWLNTQTAAEPSVRYLDDETNEDVSIPRNRVRHELLPLLAERFNPGVVDVLAREAALLQDVWAWMDDASAAVAPAPGTLDLRRLRTLPIALQRLVVWRALAAHAPGRETSFDHVASVIRLIHQDGAGSAGVDLPGLRVQRNADRIVLTVGERVDGSAVPANQFSFVLSIPGEAVIPGVGRVISAACAAVSIPEDRSASVGNGVVALVRRDLIGESLVVRNRRPGDRFRPVGLCGSKKIQDLFVDQKVPRGERDDVPIVADGSGRIVWVAGHRIDERFRVTDASQPVLVLRLTRASDGGAPA